jgi:hypothetical protein
MDLKHLIKCITLDFDNLDFAFVGLEHSYYNFITKNEEEEFLIRFTHLMYLIQHIEIRRQFTDIKSKLLKMHKMIIAYRILRLFK